MNTEDTARIFRGRTSAEVLNAIKRELGSDAIILSTRSVPQKGARSLVEIKAKALSQPATTASTKRTSILDILSGAMRSNGVNETLLERICENYRRTAPQLEHFDHSLFRSCIAGALRVRPYEAHPGTPLAVVGPTGVGKTTTIAKLAVKDSMNGLSPALITIDTHRIGGVEQLSRYAALIKAPLETAATAEELQLAITKFRDADRIYIDTAGAGPNGEERLRELAEILTGASHAARMLLLPASGNEVDLSRTAEAFRICAPTMSGATKTDETCFFGPCFNALCDFAAPLALFGTGQKVPDDLQQASTAMLSTMLTRVRH